MSTPTVTPATIVPIEYTNKDYYSFRQVMLDNAQTPGAAGYLPTWTARGKDDFGVAFVESTAYLGDILSYYIDRLVNESFIETAVLADSVRNKARLLGYRPDNGTSATMTVTFSVPPGVGTITIPKGTQITSTPDDGSATDCDLVIFETDVDLFIAQNPATTNTGQVTCTEGTTVSTESVGLANGRPAQTMTLAQSPVVEGSVVLFVDEGAGPFPWTFVPNLITANSGDRVYTTYTTGAQDTTIRFGDGINGKVPVFASPVTATYRVGGGVAGNSITSATRLSVTSGAIANSVVTVVASAPGSSGGSDPESIDSIRVNTSKSLTALNNCVTLDDYANASLGVNTVAKAKAIGLSYTSIVVYLLGANFATLSDTTKARVLAYLQNVKMVNANVAVTDGTVAALDITASITVANSFSQTAVQHAVTTAITLLLSFDNVDFGERVTLSTVYQTIMAVPGVLYAQVTKLALTGGSGTADVVLSPFQVPALGTLTVTSSGGVTGATVTDSVALIPGTPTAPSLGSLSCPSGTGYAGAFHLAVSWSAVTNATSYGVILDFYNVSAVYLGSVNGGVYTGTSATLDMAFVSSTATSVHVRIRAINGANAVDGPTTNIAYTCGTNTP